eukprot:4996906-Prymnesium_polylepis.1
MRRAQPKFALAERSAMYDDGLAAGRICAVTAFALEAGRISKGCTTAARSTDLLEDEVVAASVSGPADADTQGGDVSSAAVVEQAVEGLGRAPLLDAFNPLAPL